MSRLKTSPRAVARRVLIEEAAAVAACAERLGEPFDRAVEWLLNLEGRAVTCGVGKSGHIARKAAGTLSSTGTPSLFLHAAEAVHGDLGMVTAKDVAILYSHSGETDEIVRLFPSLRTQGAKTILLTGRPESSAGRLADLVLDTGVEREACGLELAPTTSTTVMLALSDALAMATMEQRGFGKEDFARFHPAGALGKRLLLTVADTMRPLRDIAVVAPETPMIEVVRAMTEEAIGAACVVRDGRLLGLVSEGDLRRWLLADGSRDAPASSLMNDHPASIEPTLMAVDALETFQNFPAKIGELPVVDGEGTLRGLLVLKDLLRSGIV
ncbi:KpsF/GutQ family sugar-phosphate isomerase [bacterium]|nr:MAG: KpsF/GutQ family sugar-phosphate isomerase [bacterium]